MAQELQEKLKQKTKEMKLSKYEKFYEIVMQNRINGNKVTKEQICNLYPDFNAHEIDSIRKEYSLDSPFGNRSVGSNKRWTQERKLDSSIKRKERERDKNTINDFNEEYKNAETNQDKDKVISKLKSKKIELENIVSTKSKKSKKKEITAGSIHFNSSN